MTYDEAAEHAKVISREYGRVVIFREPIKSVESYQAVVSSLPIGAAVVATFDDGKITSDRII